MELGVNIDHVATLRQARGTRYPDLAEAVRICERNDADLITLHLREDRRHIQDADVYQLCEVITTRMNLEMAATREMLNIAIQVQPNDVCLVPEKRAELTTEGGLDAASQIDSLTPLVEALKDANIRVSLFIDPDPVQIDAAKVIGADAVEIHTGGFADAGSSTGSEAELGRIVSAVELGASLGLRVNAGHGLNYDNVGPVASISKISELNIGHAIIARAVFSGLGPAVAEMRSLMNQASQ
ncbi:MAG: pyridoxine 5'-phosphate synthase [Arenicellales bacterium]|jgi:pyridoxine 5-phosphate synthase